MKINKRTNHLNNKDKMQKIILHIPHSSTIIPDKRGFVVNKQVLKALIHKLTDWYTDELFYFKKGVTVKAEFSRIFCDVERFANDADEIMASRGMGVLYTKDENSKIIREVSKELKESILTEYYSKHHSKLYIAVQSQLTINNRALILDCHSFPNKPFNNAIDKTSFRPDFNIGTDSFHTPKELVEAAQNYFDESEYSLRVDAPYSGSIVPMEFYRKNKNVHSIMLEVNRSLYMNEITLEKNDNFNTIKGFIAGFIKIISEFYDKRNQTYFSNSI